MRIITSPTAMQRTALGWRRRGERISFVPTMGYLHAGHLSLVREARRRVGRSGRVVVSIYVNPTQFAPTEDLSRYPRDFARDRKLCREAGVDVIFAPTDTTMYPQRDSGGYSTFVTEETLSEKMEGASRPTHFRGVTTVVAKLFNIVLPDVAVFGAKDWQQAAVIKRMVADLNFPLRIIVAPTVREHDGVAMSSRNKYLTGDLRRQATALQAAVKFVRNETTRRAKSATVLKKAVTTVIKKFPDARLDYVEFFDPETLKPERMVAKGSHMALAVFVGRTRLIDNARL